MGNCGSSQGWLYTTPITIESSTRVRFSFESSCTFRQVRQHHKLVSYIYNSKSNIVDLWSSNAFEIILDFLFFSRIIEELCSLHDLR